MGQAIVYCSDCQLRLRDVEALRHQGRVFCVRCAPPEILQAARARPDDVPLKPPSTTRIPKPPAPRRGGTLGWALGLPAAGLLVLAVVLSSRPREPMPAPPAEEKAVVERPPEPPPRPPEPRVEKAVDRRVELERLAAEEAALEAQIDAARREEKFGRALELAARHARKAREVAEEVEALYAKLKAEASTADESALKRLQERVLAWGLERYRLEPPPKPKPKPKEAPKPPAELERFRGVWEEALAPVLSHDFSGAAEALARAAEGLKDPAVRTEAARDVELLRLAGAAHAEARQALARSAKGQALSLEALDSAGRPVRVEGSLVSSDAFRLELRKDERITFVDLGEVRGASFAEAYLSKRPKPSDAELAAAALLCLLEGDTEAAARVAPDSGASVPAKYWERARHLAAPADAEARGIFAAAEREFGMPAGAVDAAAKYGRLLKEFADSPFVRRNAAFIATRTEPAREFFFSFEELGGGGGFRPSRAGEEEFWLSTADVDGERAPENWVEVAFSAVAGLDYRLWVWAGGCCEEALTFGWQGSETPSEPGSATWLALKPALSMNVRSHAAHQGRRAPTRWGWAQIPLPKYAEAGAKKVRVVTPRPGLLIAQALVSATRHAPPLSGERRSLERARREALGARAKVVDPALVGHWRLDEGKGESAADASGAGLAGQLKNGAAWAGGALSLGGKDACVSLGAKPPLLKGVASCTLAAWVRPDALATGSSQNTVIGIGKGASEPGTESRATLLLRDGGDVEAGGRSADGDKYQKAKTRGSPVPAGAWTHVAAVFDYAGDRISVFVNGARVASESVDFSQALTSTASPSCASIGSDDSGTRHYFSGRISDVRVYARALSPVEIALLAASAPR